jgi:hypothetical protein
MRRPVIAGRPSSSSYSWCNAATREKSAWDGCASGAVPEQAGRRSRRLMYSHDASAISARFRPNAIRSPVRTCCSEDTCFEIIPKQPQGLGCGFVISTAMIPVKLESRIKLANAEPRGNVPAISQSAQPISKPTIRKYLQDPGGANSRETVRWAADSGGRSLSSNLPTDAAARVADRMIRAPILATFEGITDS